MNHFPIAKKNLVDKPDWGEVTEDLIVHSTKINNMQGASRGQKTRNQIE